MWIVTEGKSTCVGKIVEDVTGGNSETSKSRVLHKDFNTTTPKVWKPKIHYNKILKYDDSLQEKKFSIVVNCKNKKIGWSCW